MKRFSGKVEVFLKKSFENLGFCSSRFLISHLSSSPRIGNPSEAQTHAFIFDLVALATEPLRTGASRHANSLTVLARG